MFYYSLYMVKMEKEINQTEKEIIQGLKQKYKKFLYSLTAQELDLFTYTLPDFHKVKRLKE